MKKISELMSLNVDISNKTVIRVLFLIVIFILGVQFIMAVRSALALFLISFFLALALSTPVNYLARKMPRGSRGLATAIAYIITLAIIGTLIYSIAPPVIQQSRSFVNNLPEYVNTLETADNPIANGVRRFGLVDQIRQSQDQITEQLSAAGTPIFNLLERVFSSIVALLTILVLTFFMVVEGPKWLDRFWALQPKAKRKHYQDLAFKMYRAVTGYVNGQLFIATLAGVAAFIALTVLGVPFAIPLAGIIIVTGLIPLIGNTLGAIIVIIAGLFVSFSTAVILTIFFIVYQQIENNVIQPIIQSKNVELSPLAVLVSVILGISFAGILGALLAIPIAAALRILINDYIETRRQNNKDKY